MGKRMQPPLGFWLALVTVITCCLQQHNWLASAAAAPHDPAAPHDQAPTHDQDDNESWLKWAKGAFSNGFGFKPEDAEETAKDAMDKVSDATVGVAEFASETAGNIAADGKAQVSNVFVGAKGRAGAAFDGAKDYNEVAKKKVSEAAGHS